MMGTYLKVNSKDYKKIFVVGDLHGCYDKLFTTLFLHKFNHETDLVIAVGDLIDRGDKNIECLRLINEPWFKSVRGNHEQMAINAIEGNQQSLYAWMYNGGDWFFKLDKNRQAEATNLIKQCSELPLIIEVTVNKKKYVIAHADYPHDEYEFGKAVSNKQVLWNRDRINNNDKTIIKNGHSFIFGHSPQESIKHLANRIYIDTGVVFTSKLGGMRIK